jgi:F0F1-type ATP synthase membrane subunit b/b'
LFEPNLAVLKNREERSAGALKEASRVKAEAEEMSEQYRTHLVGIRVGAMQQVDTVYRETEEQAQVLIAAARADAARTMADMREILAQELAQARQSLTASVPTFSREIAAKLLGRPLT